MICSAMSTAVVSSLVFATTSCMCGPLKVWLPIKASLAFRDAAMSVDAFIARCDPEQLPVDAFPLAGKLTRVKALLTKRPAFRRSNAGRVWYQFDKFPWIMIEIDWGRLNGKKTVLRIAIVLPYELARHFER